MSSDEAPEGRCEFVLEPKDLPDDVSADYEAGTDEWYEYSGAACCWRGVWAGADDGRCIWHADTDNKPADALVDARADGPERLDGAHVPAVELGDAIDFDGCGLQGVTFDGTDLQGASFAEIDGRMAQLHDASLRNAQFLDATLRNAQFPDADLRDAQFPDAVLTEAQFPDADLRRARFPNADLSGDQLFQLLRIMSPNADPSVDPLFRNSGAQFPDADLSNAQFSDADLSNAQFSDADLSNAQFPDADLSNAQFPDADLSNAQFPDADLSNAQFPDANLAGASFPRAITPQANFEDADLTSANLFDTDLRETSLYGAIMENVSINRRTIFGGHYVRTVSGAFPRGPPLLTVLWRPLRRLSSVIHEIRLALSSDPSDSADRDQLEKAAWSFRRVEQLSDDAGLSKQAREYNVQRKDIERRLYLVEDGSRRSWAMAMLSSLTMRYGQSPWRVVGISVAAIVAAATGYMWQGLRLTARDPTVLIGGGAGNVPLPTLIGKSLYFSTITFTTVGYGDIQPVGWSQTIATIESFLGALLMALLVYVLGRRATW